MRNNPDYAAATITGYGLMALQMGVQLLLVPLYLSALGTHRFGILMILMGQVAFGFVFANWLYSLLLRRFGETLASGDVVVFSRLFVAGKVLLVGIGLAWGLGLLALEAWRPVFFERESPAQHREILWAMAFTALHFVLMYEVVVEQAILAATKRQLYANLVTMTSLGVFALCVIPWLLSGGGLVGVAACFVVGDVAARVVAFFAVRPVRAPVMLGAALRGKSALWREMISPHGKRYFLYAVLAMALQSDLLILGLVADPVAVARFVLVWKVAEVITLLLARAAQHLQPEFMAMDVAGERGRLRRVYIYAYAGIAAAAAAFALAYAFGGQWIVGLWVGAGRVPDEPELFIFAAAAILFLGLSRLPIALAQALSRMRPLLWIAAIELAAKAAVYLYFIGEFTSLTPFLAIVVAHAGGIGAAYWLLGRRLLGQWPYDAALGVSVSAAPQASRGRGDGHDCHRKF